MTIVAFTNNEHNLRTKEVATILKALNINNKVLIVVDGENEMFLRATNNIPYVRVLPAEQINVRELVNYAKCIMTVPAIRKIEEAYKA